MHSFSGFSFQCSPAPSRPCSCRHYEGRSILRAEGHINVGYGINANTHFLVLVDAKIPEDQLKEIYPKVGKAFNKVRGGKDVK